MAVETELSADIGMAAIESTENDDLDDFARLDFAPQFQDLINPPGPTLLPTPIAKVVSIATRSTSIALRMGTLIGGFGLDAAKLTTLSSLELGRAILEGILGRAGKDVISRSGSDLGRAEAENVLEKSLENLYRTMNQIVFWTTAGFHLTSTTVAMCSETSLNLLAALDQFFGSTDSSRAMASIITLIRREFQSPATGKDGERVGVMDLMLGLCALAYLQRRSGRLIDEENRKLQVEETVWDVVVLNDGVRVDVHADSLHSAHEHGHTSDQRSSGMFRDTPNSKLLHTIEDHGAQDSEDDRESLPEVRLRRQIMRSLPQNATVSMTTRSHTTKTITVEITGEAEDLPFPPPSGLELVEESRECRSRSPQGENRHESGQDCQITPSCRVVYQLQRNKERMTSFKKVDGDISQVAGYVEEVGDDSQASSATELEGEESVQHRPSAASLRRPTSDALAASTPSTKTANPSRIPNLVLSRRAGEDTANEKRPRIPPPGLLTASNGHNPPATRRQTFNRLLSGHRNEVDSSKRISEKKGGFMEALKRPGSFFAKEEKNTPSNPPTTNPTPPCRLAIPSRTSSTVPARGASSSARPSNCSRPDSKDGVDEPYPRNSSRASYISIHERRRDSMISHTESYSIAPSDEFGPDSPDLVGMGPPGRCKRDREGEREISTTYGGSGNTVRRVKSRLYSPSIYTFSTSEPSLAVVPYFYRESASGDTKALEILQRGGMVEGMFPKHHLLRNISRYMRFASASYGSGFLRFMGIAKEMPLLRNLDDTHQELRSYATHTDSDSKSILLSSFVDPQGGSDGTGSTNTGVPLVHYISLDHESKAVVLACRGTLGFEDVLADLACDYDDLVWRGKPYKVHKGIHASARRLLYGGDGRVLYTLKQALDDFSDYGLILAGHSLGGAVTALLGVMLSEPGTGTSFVTSSEPHVRLLSHPSSSPSSHHICLPPGRPVHVFAYGPPSTMSASLRHATRGLITSTIVGNDMVPYLSLGVLHDFQAVALAFKTDNNQAKGEVRQRIWDAFQSGLADKWYGGGGAPRGQQQDEEWAYATLKVLRASMVSTKLQPPGEVFCVETTRVLRRDAFLAEGEEHIGRPAQRIVLRYVKDVEKRFREVRFGMSMLTDHSPGVYENALNRLKEGVIGGG
ncbi:hypothetical protein B0T18DRAFT_397416 [Schizothecium vesticola]|uniref:sn-1-specific diacylglycerol lipase n=1 Tax=Schizothecium vesticola TaxID=314040 RepID=A0AA40FAD7_9PEZI|nr:hypothetical protein B0T18DRAFT_397416 [Schizothecium vesticola]